MNFKREVFLGSLWSLFGNSGSQLIGFFIFIYIARHVTPADVGLVALALVVIGILSFASRFGQVEALQHRADLPDAAIDTAFWMLAAIGVVTTALVLGSAEIIHLVVPERDLPMVLSLLAPLCALQSWNAVPEAILRRRFDFRSLSVRNWIAAISGGLLGIYLAYHGYGVYALVAQRLGTAVVQTIATWAFLGWHPHLRFDRTEARGLASAGGNIMAAGFAGHLNQRITDALTGSMVGVTPLGFLRLAWRFFDVIVTVSVNPVTNVALTTFSRLENDRKALKRAYLRLTQFMACASLPMLFGLGAIADVLVPVVFGEKWLGSVVVMQLLGLVILPGTVNFFFGPAMIAVGRSRLLMWQAAVQVVVTLGLVYVGSFFGLVGIMAAVIARALFVAAYNLHALKAESIADASSVLRVLLPPTVACAVMYAAVVAVKISLNDWHDIPLLAVLVSTGAVTYGLVLVAGDYAGLWRGFVRDAVASMLEAATRRGGRKPKMEPA